jgi:hypothetical protein
MAKIIVAEWSTGDSQDVLPHLLSLVLTTSSACELRQASLDIIGFVGEEMVYF